MKLCLGLCLLLVAGVASRRPSRREFSRATAGADESIDRVVQFDHFDDYLLSIAAPTKVRSNGQNEDGVEMATTPAPELHPLDILNYFKDVPREHWSCCMLGKLAGDKGFHCHAGFYASRVNGRNFNRAHNRRMSFHTEDRMTAPVAAILHTFQRCVARHANEFHKCCYAATVERREISLWQQFRAHAERTNLRVELEN